MIHPAVTRARARAALLLFLFRALTAFLLAYPVARSAGAFLPRVIPAGDALFFADGGFYAAEAIRLGGRAIQGALEGSLLGFVAVAIASALPTAVALSALVYPAESLPALVRRGAEHTPSMIAVGGAAAFVQAVGLVVVALLVNGLSGAFDSVLDERAADLAVVAIGLIAVLPVVAVGLVSDLARAAIVRHGVRATSALRLGARALSDASGAVIVAWLPTVAGGAAIVALAAWAATAIDVSRPGAARVLAVVAVHQVTIALLVVLRLYWLERALTRLGAAYRASPVDTPGRSDEPVDPTPDPTA